MAQSALDTTFFYFDSGDNLELLCTTAITPNHTAQSTDSPVEVGSNISDHVRVNPDTLSLTIFLSEMVGQEENKAYDPDFVGEHIKVRERLIKALKGRDPVSIDLGADKGVYADMILLDVSPIWTEGEGKSPTITLQLKQLVYATTKTRKVAPKTLAGGGINGLQGLPPDPNAQLWQQGSGAKDLGTLNPKALPATDQLVNRVKSVSGIEARL